MKRERTHRILHHFSFGERFDETMMNAYCVGNKYIAYTNHQFIGFLSTNKPAGKVAEVKITIRRPDGRMSDLHVAVRATGLACCVDRIDCAKCLVIVLTDNNVDIRVTL